jgi:hypothetical protein
MPNKIIAVTINKSLIGLGANGPTSKKTSSARSLINNIVITAAIVYSGFFIPQFTTFSFLKLSEEDSYGTFIYKCKFNLLKRFRNS